jgi:hypothetical protein
VITHLIALLKENKPVEWTEDTFRQLAKTQKINSYRLKQRQQTPTGQGGANQSLPKQTGPDILPVNSRNWLPQSGSGMQDGPVRTGMDYSLPQQTGPDILLANSRN